MTRVDGLSVRVSGSGPPLILLHGFTGGAAAWPSAALEPLLAVRTVALVDLPGHGESLLELSPAEWDVYRTIERLAAVQQSCFGGPATWVGYSMGGRLALMAATAGVPMRSLLLESASPGLESEDDRSVRRARDEQLAARLEREGMEPFVKDWMDQPLFDSQQLLPDAVRSAENERRLANAPHQLAMALRGFGTGAQPPRHEQLADLRMPVALLTGELDAKFTEIAQMMSRRIPVVSHDRVQNAGHAVHLEAPAEWADWVVANSWGGD